MPLNLRFWIRISLLNLLVVAALGTLMRYKIGFSFPYFEQKHLAHGHSHFAFIGWITHTLFVLMVSVIQHRLAPGRISLYKKLIILNLISAYGMRLRLFLRRRIKRERQFCTRKKLPFSFHFSSLGH